MTAHDDSAGDHSAGHGSANHDSAAHDFMALYRELGVDATCPLADLRAAWRRRVSKLHPDQGGSAEDTGRLQELNRRYDAAVAFHARYGRLPGAPAPGTLAPGTLAPAPTAAETAAPDRGWRRADGGHDAQDAAGLGLDARGAAGFGTIARCLVAVLLIAASLIAVLLLVWRLVDRTGAGHETAAAAAAVRAAAPSVVHVGRVGADVVAPDAIAVGMSKDRVRQRLGEPIDMHALRWHYGPSWVDFRCDKVAGWYSSPLRPLGTGTARLEAPPADDTRCD
jgi:hypothetical protein